MPLTRDLKATVRLRVERDPKFREALLQEGVKCVLVGDVEVGKSVLRDYIEATIRFQELCGNVGTLPQYGIIRRSWSGGAVPRLG